jgi:hypothetical protein
MKDVQDGRLYRTLFFNTVAQNVDAFCPTCHEFKNFVSVEMGLLQSQTFTNSPLQFLIILEYDKERQISLHQCFRDYVKRGNFGGIKEQVLSLY